MKKNFLTPFKGTIIVILLHVFFTAVSFGQCDPDNVPPVITCPDNIEVSNDEGSCGATVTFSLPTATDNCSAPGNITIKQIGGQLSGSVFPVGNATVLFEAQDEAGNKSQCSFTITVKDTESPKILGCPSNIPVNTGTGVCNAIVNWTEPTAVDNCNPAQTISGSHNPGQTFPLGITEVTYTAVDKFGNKSECKFNITVEDKELPTISCPDNITQKSDEGVCTAYITVSAPLTGDNCGVATVINDFNGTSNASGTYLVGTKTVIWTVTDDNGNSNTCSMTVTVNDNEKPKINNCPASFSVTTLPGTCNANPTWILPTASDNCGISSLVSDHNSGGILPLGVTTVTYTATDVNSNLTTCSFNITVTDNEKPTITCPSDIVLENDANECSKLIPVPVPVTNDNCEVDYVINDYNNSANASDTYPVGTTDVKWTVFDKSGNSAFCIMKIQVTDNEKPVISGCPNNISINVIPGTCNAKPTWIPPTASDNCGISSLTSSHNPGDAFNKGTTTVKYTALDVNGNSSVCSFTVTVIDDEDPKITCPSDIVEDIIPGTCYQFVTYTTPIGIDNCPGSFTSQISGFGSGSFFPAGTTINTFQVTDAVGHKAECTFTVTINDKENPKITGCPSNITQNVEPGTCGKKITWTEPTASDNCSIDSLTADHASGETFLAGNTTVTYTAIDASGNKATCVFTITIIDNIKPTIACPDDILKNTSPAGACSTYVNVPVPVTADNCAVLSVINDFNGTGNASGNYLEGITTINWEVTDVNGNKENCSMTVTVVDNEKPSITCPSNVIVSNDPGKCEAGVTVSLPSNVNDNCGVKTVTNDHNGTGNASGIYPVGTTPVKWTVEDVNGNFNSCTMTVTVNDNEKPVISNCPGNITINTETGVCSAHYTWTPPTASDNCGIESFTSTHNPNDVFLVGTTTVTYTAKDDAGNTTVCSFTVTVQDKEKPTITCPANISEKNDQGACQANITVPSPVVADNCGISKVENNYTGTDNASGIYPVGTTSVVWTVYDNSNNTQTCTMTVQVIDNELPFISCPQNITMVNEPGKCNAYVTVPKITIIPNKISFGYTEDNCGINTITNDYTGTDNASGIYPVGTTTVKWTVEDVNGNINTCTMTVTVNDNEKPVITGCPGPITINAETGLCSAHVTWIPPTVTDNCGIETFTSTHNPNDVFLEGTTTVSYTAKDDAGNTTVCSFTVTVKDNQPPVIINCPVNITLNNIENVCYAIATWTVPTVQDNCTFTLTGTHKPGDQFPIGTTTVNYTATDVGGNTAICTFTVKVTDSQIPVITCPGNIVKSNDNGKCGAVVTYQDPVASDNCTGFTVTLLQGLPNGSLFPVGTTIQKYEVKDASGNTATCSFTIKVNDTELPAITCPANIVLNNTPGQCGIIINYTPPVGTDNCPDAITLQTDATGYSSGSFFPVGTKTLQYTVTDKAGNFVSCSFDVTVKDNQKPIITGCPANISVSNDKGQCGAIVSWTEPSAYDNCTTVVVTKNHSPGDFFPVGTTLVWYAAKDPAGNTDTCKFNVTVNDIQNPTVNCPYFIKVDNDNKKCGAVVSFNIIVDDNCPGATWSLTSGLPSGSFFLVGTTANYITVTDASGNSASCTFNVEVVDVEAPVITCPSVPAQISNDEGECGAIVTWTAPATTDNCGIDGITSNYNSGDFFNVGETTVTYTVYDINDNSSECSFIVKVVDNEDPIIHDCPVDFTVNNGLDSCGAKVTWIEPWAQDNCNGGVTKDLVKDGVYKPVGVSITPDIPPGSFFPVGTTTVTYTATDDAGNTSTCTFDVTVKDVQKPAIKCPADITNNNSAGICGKVINYSIPVASDNCPGFSISQTAGIPSGNTFPVGETINTFVVTDASGNTAQCSFKVTIIDNEKPMITCPQNITTTIDKGNCTKVVTYTVNYSDNCSGSILTQTAGLASGSAFPIGVTLNKFIVTDKAGNKDSCSFTVTVSDNELPSITCPGNITVNNNPGKCSAIVTFAPPSGSDNCPGFTIKQTGGFTSGTAFPAGTTLNKFVITDAAGNKAECTFTVTVKDVEYPVISNCPGNITMNSDAGSCGAIVSWIPPTSTDNCAVVSFTSNKKPGDFFTAGVTTVTYTAVDGAGNNSKCSFIVTVKDITVPTITCPGDLIVKNDAGVCGAVITYTVTTNDNCSGPVLTQKAGLPSGSLFPVGTTINTFEVKDAAGNTATCSFNVTVNDTEKPVITCPSNIIASNDKGKCGAVVTYTTPVGTDNCSGAVTTQTAGLASGSFFPIGTTLNTFLVTDAKGNTSSCSFNVVVNDNEYPVITCPQDITVNLCHSTVTYTTPVGTDNCSGAVTIQTAGLPSGSVFPLGKTTNTYKVTDGAGNTFTCSFDVTVEPNPSPDLGDDIVSCKGDQETIDAGPAVSYLWSNGATTQTIHVTLGGTYSVTVTDSEGCTGVDAINVLFNDKPTLSMSVTNAGCGDADGIATVTATGGTGTYTYLWSTVPAQTNATATGLTKGVYNVTVNDGQCSAVGLAIVNEEGAPVVSVVPTSAEICINETVTINASGADTYTWSPATGLNTTTGPTVIATPSDNIIYTVTGVSSNCSSFANVTITVNLLPVVNLGGNKAICEGSTQILNAGNGFTSYKWSTGATTQIITVASADTYSVTVTNNKGCKGTDVMTLTVNPLPIVLLGGNKAICEGGSYVLDAGVGFTAYNWSTGATTQMITITSANTYSVTVTNANGCKATDAMTLTVNPLPVVTLGGDKSICAGGSLTLDAGAGFTNYLWSNNSTDQQITVSSAGPYSVTVTNANGCKGTDAMILTVNSLPVVTLGGDKAICEGETLTLDAGIGYTAYDWSTEATTQKITVSEEDDYSVTVTDYKGCTGVGAMTLTINESPVVDLGDDVKICNGQVQILDAGSGHTDYSWSTGDTEQQITVSTGSDYSVTVTDENGCTGSDIVKVTVNTIPVIDLGDDASICEGETLTLDAGTGFSKYNWSTGATVQQITVEDEDSYIVTVTDANGCTAIDGVNIEVMPLPEVKLGDDVAICLGETYTLDAGAGFTSYNWSTGATVQQITVSLADTYSVTVTNANGCKGTDAIIVTVNPLPVVNLGKDMDICAGSSLKLDAGTGYAAYNWSTGATVQQITVTLANTYSVTVTNSNGCKGTDAIVVAVNPLPVVKLGADASICEGESYLANAGTGYTKYLWSDNSTNQTLNITVEGNYSVTVTNSYGCTGSDTIKIDVNPLPKVQIVVVNANCGNKDGSATANATGGSGTFTYLWSTVPAQTTAMATGLGVGVYYVTVNDGFCPVVAQAVVNENGGPVVTVTPDDTVICKGASVILIAKGADTYVWEPAASLNDATEDTVTATPDQTTVYTVTGTKAGCSGIFTVTVTISTPPVVNLGKDTILTNQPDTIVLNAGSGFTKYLWQDGKTTSTYSVSVIGWYKVTVTNQYGCTGVDSVYIDYLISIVTVNGFSTSVSIYPNPARESFTLEVNSNYSGDVSYEIFGSSGQIIFRNTRKNVSEYTERIDISTYPRGIYFIRIQTEHSTKFEKVVIQ